MLVSTASKSPVTYLISHLATDLILKRAQAVEKGVYDLRGTADAEYKGKIRSLFVNLRDKGNPSLREGVISGDVPAEKLATMTSEVKIHPPRFDAACSPRPGNGLRRKKSR